MRNLALQGEVRHVLPAARARPRDGVDDDAAAAPLEGTDVASGTIVAVIRNNAHAELHVGPHDFDGHYAAEGFAGSGGAESERSTQHRPPASFVATSDGHLLALDASDRRVWAVDLEKAAAESREDDGDEEGRAEGPERTHVAAGGERSRSRWFYAARVLAEHAPATTDDAAGAALGGLQLGGDRGLHVTCLSRGGHVISVSVDATNSIVAKGADAAEEGSECIGSFDNGLECGRWSPDGEVLALVTFSSDEDEDGNEIAREADPELKVPILMTMNTEYEILEEVRLDPCLFPVDSDNTDGAPHPNAISLCWRPDSSSLAVSTMDRVNKKCLRRIRTYHRTTLQIISLSKEEDGSGRDVPNLLPVAPVWAPAQSSHYVGAVQSSRPLTMKSARARQASLQVAFMEPNGLRHSECKIHSTVASKTDKEEVEGIAFNSEGDLLAVTSTVTSKDTASNRQYRSGKVQLYHRSNYHWYLKYELRYDGHGAPPSVVSGLQFSEEEPYRLVVALKGPRASAPEWREYTFRWEASAVHGRCDGAPAASSVLATVIDGKKLNFTPLDKALVPPPMCAAAIDLPAPVVGVASLPFSRPTSNGNGGQVDFVVALSDGTLALLQSGTGGQQEISLTPGFRPPSLLAIVNPFDVADSNETFDSRFSLQGMTLRDITIIDADDNSLTVVALSCPNATSGKHCFVDHVVEMQITCSARTSMEGPVHAAGEITLTSSVPLEGRALRLVNWSDAATCPGARGGALLQLADGTLHEYSRGGIVEHCDAGPLLEACPWIAGVYDAAAGEAAAAAPFGADGDAPRDPRDEASARLVIGLSHRYRLYCGERLLSSASSSFFVSLPHRFVTHVTIGSRPQLRFLSLASLRDYDPLMGSEENMALDGYEPRSVESGARLVAVFPTRPMAILQMPRGNLESISPRALVLPYVMLKIREGDFRTALDIMRRQRVDMNLIVDLDPSHFLEKGGAEHFIGQIHNIDHINLFLSSLIDVDTTLWKYPVPSWIRANEGASATPGQITEGHSKVNKVCIKMREVMACAEKEGVTASGKKVKEHHFLLPTLSTFAKETPPKLEEALTLIKNMAPGEPSKHLKGKSTLLSEHVQQSITYLAFLADYELIFNTAIGLYDFDLAKAVARHSQMDPKVYLPMLKRWRELPEDTARYEVDVKLKRYESALRHLVAAYQVNEELSTTDGFEKCLKFVEEHGLHKLGLDLFKGDTTNHRAVMVSLGEHLLSKRKPEEALTVFLASSPRHLDGAKRASRSCGDWRTYFACCAEDGKTVEEDVITSIVESISSKVGTMSEQRKHYLSAATILLDYGEDVAYAIEMLISARLWSEGRRVAYLHGRPDLVKKVVDGSVSFAQLTVADLVERTSAFEKSNKRYAEVIVLRRDALREADEAGVGDAHLDDTASMFSMQSTASNTSLRSSASYSSVGSVGSVASVSTVISVGATSTFSFTGAVDSMKHKSKFNKVGRDNKKKKRPKRKGPNARKIKPGSEEELKELVATLVHTCPDAHWAGVIGETITFLLHSDKQSMATLLFEAYSELDSVVTQCQTARVRQDEKEREEYEQRERKEGRTHSFIEHSCEKDINAIMCKPLQETVQSTLSFLL